MSQPSMRLCVSEHDAYRVQISHADHTRNFDEVERPRFAGRPAPFTNPISDFAAMQRAAN